MKVGILSMQRIKNYGSFLQAYGLKSILEELGADVEFVDYHPGKTLVPSDEGKGIIRKISKLLDVVKISAPLREKIKFINYKKNYEKNYFPYLGITSKKNYSPNLDLLVIGSDEVFNCVQSNTNVGFAPELFGQGNNAKKLITYAASFGNTSIKKLKDYGVDEKIANYLQNFDAISTRDENSSTIVKELTGLDVEKNLDPVLIYNFIDSGMIPKLVEKEKYLLLYGYSGRFTREECNLIRLYTKKMGLKVYCIGGLQECCDKFIDCDPFKVIAYFKNAEVVVTDTFHGTIMSIITHKRFASIIRENGYGNSQKLSDLLKRLNLLSRKLNNWEELEELLSRDIDYTNTDRIILEEKIKTYNYLNDWIN